MSGQTFGQRFLKEMISIKRVHVARMFYAGGLGIAYFAINGPLLHLIKEHKLYGFRTILEGHKMRTGLVQDHLAITPELQSLIDQVVKDVKFLDDKNKNNISFSSEAIIEPRSIGTAMKSQAFVFLPDYFNMTDFKDLKAFRMNKFLKEIHNFEIKNTVDWMSREGRLLIDSFCLSEKAKKFAIAREIYACDRNNVSLASFYIFFSSFMFFVTNDVIRKRLIEKKINPSSSGALIIHSINMVMIGLAFLFFRVLMTMKNQAVSDTLAVSGGLYENEELESRIEKTLPHNLPIDYYEGGLEFYIKMKQRNTSLRKLMLKEAGTFSYNYRVFSPEGQYKPNMMTITRKPQDLIEKFKQFRYGVPQTYFEKNDWGLNTPDKRKAAKKRKENMLLQQELMNKTPDKVVSGQEDVQPNSQFDNQ